MVKKRKRKSEELIRVLKVLSKRQIYQHMAASICEETEKPINDGQNIRSNPRHR